MSSASAPIAATRRPTTTTRSSAASATASRRQQRLREEEFQRPRHLWRPRGAEDRPRRQLDRHADDHAPEFKDQGRRSSWTRHRRSRHRSASARSRQGQIHASCADRSKARSPISTSPMPAPICIGRHPRSPITPIIPTPTTQLLRRATAASRTITTISTTMPAIDIDPHQYIVGTNNFKKMSQELRVASPADKPFRVIAGAFYQRQTNDILQDYQVDNLADDLSVNGRPGTLWLTKQERIDRDYALFGEASFDVTPQITLTGGGRCYKFDNTVFGFAGFGRNPLIQGRRTMTISAERCGQHQDRRRAMLHGQRRYAARLAATGTDTTLILDGALSRHAVHQRRRVRGWQGQAQAEQGQRLHPPPQRARGSRNDDMMFYAHLVEGLPAGRNQPPAGLAPYDPDFLTNYELGWKTTFGPVRWNGAIYHQMWEKFQFSFLGENSLTVVQNGRDARINGIETDVNYVARRADPERGRRLHRRQDQGEYLQRRGRHDAGLRPAPGPDDPDTRRGRAGIRFHRRAERARACRSRRSSRSPARRAMPGTWERARRTSRSASSTRARRRADLEDRRRSAMRSIRTTCSAAHASTLVDLFAGFDWRNIQRRAVRDEHLRRAQSIVALRRLRRIAARASKIVPGRPRTIGLRAGMKF